MRSLNIVYYFYQNFNNVAPEDTSNKRAHVHTKSAMHMAIDLHLKDAALGDCGEIVRGMSMALPEW